MLVALFFALACRDAKQGSETSASTSSTSTSGGESSSSGAAETSTTAPASETSSSDGGESTTEAVDFVAPMDVPSTSECDVWAQDCPEGEKCMPWASGGGAWDATRCSPVADNPNAPGDDCTVEGSDVSGIDDCDATSMCFAIDPETNIGTCVAFCEGSPQAPICADPDRACSVSNDGVLILCAETCDPLLQDCSAGSWPHGCYSVQGEFLCWPDYSFDQGGYGEPCEYFNYCDIGLFCAIPEAVPGCVSSYCCSQYCALDEPNACPDMAMGQECLSWFLDGQIPPGMENIGFCGVMQ